MIAAPKREKTVKLGVDIENQEVDIKNAPNLRGRHLVLKLVVIGKKRSWIFPTPFFDEMK